MVHLASIAVYKANLSELPTDAETWITVLRNLTPEFPNDEPWHMVVNDIIQPALLQVPIRSEKELSEYKSSIDTPDALDILVQAKNHDLKMEVASRADPEDWLFALVTLQTSAGFSGAGHHGISRMNGGFGSRPAFSLTPSTRPGLHVRRDIEALLVQRPEILAKYPMSETGMTLLWTTPWGGKKDESVIWTELDPFYIEVCRRIRLFSTATGTISGQRATSRAARIDAKALKGRSGDPWTPVNQKEGKSLTLAKGGFTYKRIVEYLLSRDWERPPLLNLLPSEKKSPDTMFLLARGMVRGQGKTEGYYERIIPLKPKTGIAIGNLNIARELHDIAHERIEQIALVQRILRHAVSVFAAGTRDNTSEEHRAWANDWANQLDHVLDTSFFDDLQQEFETTDPDQRQHIRDQWLLEKVVEQARRILRNAVNALPCPSIHFYQAHVRAFNVLEGRLRSTKGLPHLFTRPEREEV